MKPIVNINNPVCQTAKANTNHVGVLSDRPIPKAVNIVNLPNDTPVPKTPPVSSSCSVIPVEFKSMLCVTPVKLSPPMAKTNIKQE